MVYKESSLFVLNRTSRIKKLLFSLKYISFALLAYRIKLTFQKQSLNFCYESFPLHNNNKHNLTHIIDVGHFIYKGIYKKNIYTYQRSLLPYYTIVR